MQTESKYEILNGLPPYGPMYIPISVKGDNFYQEGFVVKFYRADGTNWVANFKTGISKCSNVCELKGTNKIIVIAHGQGYVMTSEEQKPIDTFGYGITELFEANNNKYVAVDQTDFYIIENDASIWRTERISWDGFKDLSINDNIISGLSFDPCNEVEPWYNFSVNIDTGEVTGGSYKRYNLKN